MNIKPSVINSFNRVGIPYQKLLEDTEPKTVANRFSGVEVITTALVAHLIDWVYRTNNRFDLGMKPCRLDDFDRIRYFVLATDEKAYMECLD